MDVLETVEAEAAFFAGLEKWYKNGKFREVWKTSSKILQKWTKKDHAGQINKPKLKLDFNRRIHPKVSFYWLIKKIEQKISKLTTKRIALDLELFC